MTDAVPDLLAALSTGLAAVEIDTQVCSSVKVLLRALTQAVATDLESFNAVANEP